MVKQIKRVMKEPTIEQKAKRYDEAIERVENIMTGKCETTFMFTKGLFEYIFPELAESDDEKVRKELLLDIPKVFPHDKAIRYIAYLEKQGEPTDIPADAVLDGNKDGLIADTIRLKPKFKVGDKIQYKNKTYTIKEVQENYYVLDNNMSLGFYAQDVWELVEQKPAWSEDDEAILSWCISDIERAKYCRSQTKPELCDIEINWLKTRVGCELKRATTCMPSEEEMKALEFCIEHNIDKDGVFGSKVVKLYDELKKLKG